jgi:hypothetical protein
VVRSFRPSDGPGETMKVRAILFATAVFTLIAGAVGFAVAEDQPGGPAPAPADTAAPHAATSGDKAAATAAVPPPTTTTPTRGAASAPATAQGAPTAPAGSTTATAPATPAAPTPSPARLSREQLDQLLAPVALYPDQLLDQVVMASTYPLEVVEAARWVKLPAHRRLRGTALLASLKPLGLDPSVMALVPFPRLLAIMSEKLQWTEELGNAFLAQQADVLNAVQRLRREALAAGSLDPAKCRCKVVHRADAIEIEPVSPAAVYVPVCNPLVAYGPWPYPLYRPVIFPVPVGYVWAPVPFVWFYPVVTVAWYGPLWGWAGFDWWHANIIVNSGVYAALTFGHPWFRGAVWVHDPMYRDGFRYADPRGRFARAAIVGAAGGAVAAHAALRHAAVLRGRAHGGWHGAAFRGGPHGGWHGAAVRGGGWHGGGPHGGWHGAAAVHGGGWHGGPHGGWHGAAAVHGGGPHGGGPHMAVRGGGHGRRG